MFQRDSFLFHIFREICQFHIALASQRVVHSERSRQVMTGLTHLRDLQVIPQQLLVVRMCTVLDDYPDGSRTARSKRSHHP